MLVVAVVTELVLATASRGNDSGVDGDSGDDVNGGGDDDNGCHGDSGN